MKPANPGHQLRTQIDVHQCELPQADLDKMRAAFSPLLKQVGHFPTCDLHVLVEYNARSLDYSVKVSLILPGDTLVASEHGPQPYPAFEACINILMHSLQGYKDQLGNVPNRAKTEKGTRHEVEPTIDPDATAVQAAVAAGDYAAFRNAMMGYEDPLNARVGRWVKRYPAVDARIGKDLTIADVVEDVFLDAFENWATRHPEVPLGEWLENLIDPALKDLLNHRDEEMENVRLARSYLDAERTKEEK